MNLVIAYLLGLGTLPAAAALLALCSWAFSRDTGIGGCVVEGCNRSEMPVGEHFNITVWLSGMRHKLVSGPAHRKGVLAYWQAKKDRGLPVHPRVASRLY